VGRAGAQSIQSVARFEVEGRNPTPVTKTIKVTGPDGSVIDAELGPDVNLSKQDVRDTRDAE
jgi:hypothetical protein